MARRRASISIVNFGPPPVRRPKACLITGGGAPLGDIFCRPDGYQDPDDERVGETQRLGWEKSVDRLVKYDSDRDATFERPRIPNTLELAEEEY